MYYPWRDVGMPWPIYSYVYCAMPYFMLQTFSFSCVNHIILMLTSSWTWSITSGKWEVINWQHRVTPSIVSIQRLGHWAHNCKIAYYRRSLSLYTIMHQPSLEFKWIVVVVLIIILKPLIYYCKAANNFFS